MQKLQKDKLYFLPLGGAGEIGMNLNLYCYNNKWLMVDLGISFDKELGIELVMPDITFVKQILSDLLGLVITHAHEDHIGAIPYLWSELKCPIYASPFAAHLIRGKLKDAGLINEAEIIEINVDQELNLYPFTVKHIPITHSIPESFVLNIGTDIGNIVHTGDWKIDKNPLIGHNTDVEQLQKISEQEVLALVCDSTNVFEPGNAGSEQAVKDSLYKLIAAQKQRVIITSFASNVARIATFLDIAKKTNREVILSGRSLWRIAEVAQNLGYIDPAQKFYPEDHFKNLDRRNTLLICTGSQGESRASLVRIANHRHKKVKLNEGDTVIFSARVIPGNEKCIHELQDLLTKQGLIVVTDQDYLTHVSGHPNQDDLLAMYDWIKPNALIPVHGEKRHLREHAAFALEHGIQHATSIFNGTIIEISSTGLSTCGTVHSGRMVLDGSVIKKLEDPSIIERKIIATQGCIFISINLLNDKSPKIIIDSLGISGISKNKDIIDAILLLVKEEMQSLPSGKINNINDMQNKIAKSIKQSVKHTVAKFPIVRCHVIQ